MTIHYTHREWNALSTEKKLEYFNNQMTKIVRDRQEVRVTFY